MEATQVKLQNIELPEQPPATKNIVSFPAANSAGTNTANAERHSVSIRPQPFIVRLLDIVGASVGLVLTSPFMLLGMLLIWLEDRHSPFYVAERIGAGGKPFKFYKLRSISKNLGVKPDEIITSDDPRVSRLGHFIRASKLDELPQFIHVLRGEMSLVGPRANVPKIVNGFTKEEREIISVKPGITDLASIVFLNLGKVLEGSDDPVGDYNRLVRPWKSRLALIYVKNQSPLLAVRVIWLTVLAFFSHKHALEGVARIVQHYTSNPKLERIVRREDELSPYHPPGEVNADDMGDQNGEQLSRSAV